MGKQISAIKAVMIESALLRALAHRVNYDLYMTYVVVERLLPETQVILSAYKDYYALYSEHMSIDFSVFLTQFTTNWHAQDMHQDDINWYSQAILRVQSENSQDAETALMGLVNKQFIDQFNKIVEKPFTSEQIRKLIDNYENRCAGISQDFDKDCFTCDDVDFQSIDKSLGIPYALKPLQEKLGGMVAGSLVVLNAASGVGKTGFIHTQVVHTFKWLHEMDNNHPILFLNTEGTLSEVFGRFWSNLYQHKFAGYYEILQKQKIIQEHFKKTFNSNLFLAFTANDMGINYIRMKIKKYKPSLVILDMAAAIMTSVSRESNETNNLKAFFNTLRQISADYCPIIATVQAGATAKYWDKEAQVYKYKPWVADDDIYGSKSAVQGAAETIIGIGRDNDHEFTRYIQTTKKKVRGRHARFTCEIDEEHSSYKLIESVLNEK